MPTPTTRELDVLSILWREGSGTVKEGKAYRYHPVLQPEVTGRSALGRLLDKVFHGSATVLFAQLVDEQNLSADELAEMRALLDARLKMVARALQWQEYGSHTVPPEIRANMALGEPRRRELEAAGVVPYGEQPTNLRGSGIAGVMNTANEPHYMKNMEP